MEQIDDFLHRRAVRDQAHRLAAGGALALGGDQQLDPGAVDLGHAGEVELGLAAAVQAGLQQLREALGRALVSLTINGGYIVTATIDGVTCIFSADAAADAYAKALLALLDSLVA